MASESPQGWSKTVGDNLQQAIAASDKTLEQLADEACIPLSTFFRRYKGKYPPWNTEEIEAVAGALGIDPADLVAMERADVDAQSDRAEAS